MDEQKNHLPSEFSEIGNSREVKAETVSLSFTGQKLFQSGDANLLAKIIQKSISDGENAIEMQRKYPNSPIYSTKEFEEFYLKPDLLRGIKAMGFSVLSKIQEKVLPILLAESEPPQNVVAQSQSGTGKTVAFVLAMLNRVDIDKKYPQVLCLCPTYELAVQTGEVAAEMLKFCSDIKVRLVVNDETSAKLEPITDHVIIGTPREIMALSVNQKLFNLRLIKVFVMDEADMLVMRSKSDYITREAVDRIFFDLNYLECQMVFFSATFKDSFFKIVRSVRGPVHKMRLQKEEQILDNIKQYYVKCMNKTEKYSEASGICNTISAIGQVMIFCESNTTAEWLYSKMKCDTVALYVINDNLTTNVNQRLLNDFKNGIIKVMITTNVLSRGIDVKQLKVVINFDMPLQKGEPDFENYLHRIGRAGRFGKEGFIVNLIGSQDTAFIC